MKAFMKLAIAIIIALSLCACKTMSGDPANNMVYYGPNDIININKDFRYIGGSHSGHSTDDAGGGISKGRLRIESHNYVKVNDRNNVEELLSVRNKTLGLNWYFLPSKDIQDSYFEVLMPNYNEGDMVLYNLARNMGYNYVGRHKGILFNQKWSKRVTRDIIYSIHTSLIPKNLNESETKKFIKQKAMNAINKSDKTIAKIDDRFIEMQKIIDARDLHSITINVFESSLSESVEQLKRYYSNSFNAKDVQHIFFELNAQIDKRENPIVKIELTDVWYKDGEYITSNTYPSFFNPPYSIVNVFRTSGFYQTGKWPAGNYKVSIFDRHNSHIGSANFTIK